MEYIRLLVSSLVSDLVEFLGIFRRERPPKLLVVKLDHVGDVVTATPVFRVLREAFPGATLHALVGSGARELLAASPFLDKVIPYDAKRFRRPEDGPAHGHPYRVMAEVASGRYTHVIDLRGDSWTLLLPFMTGAKYRVDRGTVRLDDWVSRRMGRSRHVDREPLHEVETNLAVARQLIGPTGHEPVKVEIFLPDRDRAAVGLRLKAMGVPDGVPLVTIHPCANWKPRAWRVERFAELGRQLLARHDVHVLFVGTTEDLEVAERIGNLLRDRRAHLLFDWRLAETAALIERSALFIGNDSGIAHLAAAVGTPVVALFGPQDPRRFRPWSDRAVVLHKRVECFPCDQTVCVHADLPCVNLIYVEEVLRSAEAVLGHPVPEHPKRVSEGRIAW